MLALSLIIVAVIEPFAVLFTRRTWAHAHVLVIGTLRARSAHGHGGTSRDGALWDPDRR